MKKMARSGGRRGKAEIRKGQEEEEEDEEGNTTSRDNLIFSNFIRCASIKIQPACRLDIVIPLVPSREGGVREGG